MREEILKEELNSCVGDWGEFNVDVKPGNHYNGWDYFTVIIDHKTIGSGYEFRARVDEKENCEMDYHEDSWNPINMGNLFAWMWFETAQRKAV